MGGGRLRRAILASAPRRRKGQSARHTSQGERIGAITYRRTVPYARRRIAGQAKKVGPPVGGPDTA